MVEYGRGRTVTTMDGRRDFALFPAAVLVYVVDGDGRFLLLSKPDGRGRWEVVNGGLEAGETVVEGALRETGEEAGPDVRVRPLGVFHGTSFHYDERVTHMLSIFYLMDYLGGEPRPGDVMQGADWRFCPLDDLRRMQDDLVVPSDGLWSFERALTVVSAWRAQGEVPLQRDLSGPIVNKYTRTG